MDTIERMQFMMKETKRMSDTGAQIIIPHAWTILKILPGITFGLMLYTARKQYKSWNSGFFASVIHVDIVTIIKSKQNPTKYRMFPRVCMHKDLHSIIPNNHGVKQIQKAARQCTFTQPFISIQPIYHQWYFYNSIICAIEQEYKQLWFKRDIDLNQGIEGNFKTNVLYQKYIMALCFPWNLTVNDIESMDELKELNSAFDIEFSGHKIHKKMRGFLINENSMISLSNNKEFENLKDKSIIEWVQYLDIDGVKQGTPNHLDVILKWSLIKKMIEKYQEFDGEGPWAQPLCNLEVPIWSDKAQHIDIEDIPHCNAYNPTYYCEAE